MRSHDASHCFHYILYLPLCDWWEAASTNKYHNQLSDLSGWAGYEGWWHPWLVTLSSRMDERREGSFQCLPDLTPSHNLALEFSLPLLLPTPPWPSLCLSLSVCFLSSYYPIWPASHYKPIRRTYNTISHLQPPLRPLSSFYYNQPGAGPGRWASRQHLVKMQDGDFVCPKYHMPDGEAEPGHDLGLLIRKQAIFINWSNKH